MLVLKRDLGEAIVLDGEIFLSVFKSEGKEGRCSIALDAPNQVKIFRGELYPEGSPQRKKCEWMRAKALKHKTYQI